MLQNNRDNLLDMIAERRACNVTSKNQIHSEGGINSATLGQETQECTDSKQIHQGQDLCTMDLEIKNAQLRRKLSTSDEEKASLLLENRELISELEALQLELASSKTKVRVLGSTVGSKTSSVCMMKEEVAGLEAEVETLRQSHRDVDMKLKDTQETLAIKNTLVAQLKEELKALKAVLDKQSTQASSVEWQRDEALHKVKEQTDALQNYKASMTDKIKKLMDSEAVLKERLVQYGKEKVELEKKCSQLEQERDERSRTVRELKKDSERTLALSAEAAASRSRLEEALRWNMDLERRLSETELAAREVEVLKRESTDLQLQGQERERRLEERGREAEQYQAELASLEAILSMLHLREDGGGLLCAKPCLLAPVLTGSTPNLKPGMQYQQLLPVFRLLEQERVRLAEMNQSLQEKLDQAKDRISSLKASVELSEQSLLQLRTQLEETRAKLSLRDEELKEKSTCLITLEKELEEKIAECTLAVEQNQRLERRLLESSRSVQHFKNILDEKKRDYQQHQEESQRSHTLKCRELQDQIQQLHVSSGHKQTRVEDLEKALSETLQEKQDLEQKADSLQSTLTQLNQDTEANRRRDEEALRNVVAQAAQSATQVRSLQTALASCQEELNSCQKQIEEAQSVYQHHLECRGREVEALQVEVRNSTVSCQNSSEQIVQLQYTVQRQQALLQTSTAHINELVESQSQLAKQVRQLEEEKALAISELKKTEQSALEAGEVVQRHQREAAALSSSVTQLQEDMSKCRGELSDRETELLNVRQASDTQASQLQDMEKVLQKTKDMLDEKTEMVSDLEEKVQRSKRDRRNSLHRTQLLERQMRTVRGELEDTRDHLQALRDVLRRSQQKAEERKAAMERLTAELREVREELDQMRKEVENKDQTLKNTEDKFQQTALELNHLEVAVQNYKVDMEQKLAYLQGALEKSAREVTERTKQVEYLTERLELVQTQVQGKEKLEQDSTVQIQQLHMCRAELSSACVALQESRTQCDTLALHLQESRTKCDTLALQLQEDTKLRLQKESVLRCLEEEVEKMQENAAKQESRLQRSVSTLTQELHTLRKQHQAELCALQESHAEVLKASDCVANTLRCSQLHLSEELQHCRAQLDEANLKSAALLAELHAREQLLQHTSETLLLKESELTRLKTRLSCIERLRELQAITELRPDVRSAQAACSQPRPEGQSVSGPGPNQSREPHPALSDSLRRRHELTPQHQAGPMHCSNSRPSSRSNSRSTLTCSEGVFPVLSSDLSVNP